MKSKELSKSAVEKIEKSLNEVREILRPKSFMEGFENWIEKYPKLEDAYYYVYRKFKYGWWNPSTAWYKVKYGVQNLVRYFKLIWNDRDWDYRYWLEMNHKKLKGMENGIRGNDNHTTAKRDADNIHLAVLALERLLEDDYHENAFKNHDKKYGDLKLEWVDAENNCKEARFSRSKVKTDRQLHYEHKSAKRLYRHTEYMKKQDLEYVTKIINKYLFQWWD